MMLIQIWMGALTTLTYGWGLVDQRHKKKVERHNSEAPKPASEVPLVDVDEEREG
jgi:hypothetical protein